MVIHSFIRRRGRCFAAGWLAGQPPDEGATLEFTLDCPAEKKTNSSREPFTSLSGERSETRIINSARKWRAIKIDLGSHNKNTCNQSREDASCARGCAGRWTRHVPRSAAASRRGERKNIIRNPSGKTPPKSAAHFSEPIFIFV